MAVAVLKKSSLITIYGGSGFVGRHIVRSLAQKGYRIRVAVRRPDLAIHLQPLGGVGQIHAVQANLRHEDSVRHAADGADAVINLVGILFQRKRQSFKAIHDEGARIVAQAAREAGVSSLVHMSAIGADKGAKSRYARTKALGEEAVLEEFPSAVILRSSVIFGPEDDFFNRFAGLARMAPVLPLIGGGKTRMQPIYVGDVAEAVVAALEGGAAPGSLYELGGPEILTLRQIMEKVLHFTGRNRGLVSVPFFFAKLKALFLQMFPNPMLTVDQVRLLQIDNVVSKDAISEGRTLKGLGVEYPHAVDTIVPTYLDRFRIRGQFSTVRNGT